MLWEFWFNRFQWGMVGKRSINPNNFFYAATLTTAQFTALPEDVDGKTDRRRNKRWYRTYICAWGKTTGWIPQAKTAFWLDCYTVPESHWCFGNGVQQRTQQDSWDLSAVGKEATHWRIIGTVPFGPKWIGSTLQFRNDGDQNLTRGDHRKPEQQRDPNQTVPVDKNTRGGASYSIVLRAWRQFRKGVRVNNSGNGTEQHNWWSVPSFQIKTEPVGAIRGGYRDNRQRGQESYRERPGPHKETGGATIAINLTLPQNTWQDVRLVAQPATFAVRQVIMRKHVGETWNNRG